MVAIQVSAVGRSYHGRRSPTILIALQEQGVQQLPETTAKGTSGDGQEGVDAYGLVQSERSKGECQRASYATTRIDHYQPGREVGLTEPSGVSHLWSISQRGQPKHSLPSRLSWSQSPCSARNIRYVLMLYLRQFSDDHICRTPSPLRTRSKYFSCASLLWRSFLSSLQLMRRNRSVGREYRCMQSVSVQSRYSSLPQ